MLIGFTFFYLKRKEQISQKCNILIIMRNHGYDVSFPNFFIRLTFAL